MEINNLKVDEDRNRIAKKAGLLYLLIIVSSILTLIFIDSQYSVSGEVVETINNIVANDLFFRINTAYNLLMYIGVIALSIYLYETLKVINKPLALMAFSFRLVEAIMGGIQVLCYLIVLLLLNENNFILAFDMDAKLSLVELFMGIFDQLIIIIFAFLGFGSLIFFYLFYKSKYIPRSISIPTNKYFIHEYSRIPSPIISKTRIITKPHPSHEESSHDVVLTKSDCHR